MIADGRRQHLCKVSCEFLRKGRLHGKVKPGKNSEKKKKEIKKKTMEIKRKKKKKGNTIEREKLIREGGSQFTEKGGKLKIGKKI